MKEYTMILSREIALLYLTNEFPNHPLKVTTILSDEGIWTGKVILEDAISLVTSDDFKLNDFEYLKNIYGRQI